MKHRRMAAPINSTKHFIPKTDGNTSTGVIANLVIANAVAAGAVTNVEDVVEGSVIRAVHVELWMINVGSPNTTTQVVMILEKIPAGQTSPLVTNILNLQSYQNKKNILFTFQGNLANIEAGSNPISPLRDWVLIPKGKQRFGLGDRLVLSFLPVSQGLATCGMFIYKEYS